MFREMKNYLPYASIFSVSFTLVYASQSRVAFRNPSRDPTSKLNESFETSFHETDLKRPDSPYLQLPIFQHSRVPLLDKEQFSPAHGSGREELPEGTKKVLIPPAGDTQQAPHRSGRSHGINVACYLKKMVVQVNKQILGPEGLEGKLKLGTCDISKTTRKYHLFIYDMDQCGSKRKLIKNRVAYSNVLHYFPEISQGPIRRAMPFSNEIECHFNRYHYSYKIGFTPQVEYQGYFRPLKTTDSVVLTPRDAMWKRLSPTDAYTIGDSMYFQADGPTLAEEERLFVDSCYVTSDISHLSMPRYTVIENHGCMTDSKSSRWSRFIQSEERNIVQFSLEAFLFRGMIGKHLYMHCDIYVGDGKSYTV
ncbi:zona pellucida sperm-binding protein 3d.2 isoform X2 [Triplophysa dalaica]|uniref:zona pellucida sperm-binding protein 3d.2 isoform X2 n=1 Tax=Triplophysa dalaica TaxID=1582913 RepID=UPI0024DFCA49|nr:zona pellucida sperm-binding protein 3d.2 isoform X2 [Triplophysa dalaica]